MIRTFPSLDRLIQNHENETNALHDWRCGDTQISAIENIESMLGWELIPGLKKDRCLNGPFPYTRRLWYLGLL